MSQLLPYSCVLIIMAEKTGNKWKKTRKIPASASAKEPRLLTCYDNVNIQWLVMLSVLRYLFHLQSLDCILSLSLQSEDGGGFFVRPQSPHFVSWFMWKLEWFSPMSCIGATHCCCCKHYFGFLIKVELLSCSHCCSCREGGWKCHVSPLQSGLSLTCSPVGAGISFLSIMWLKTWGKLTCTTVMHTDINLI